MQLRGEENAAIETLGKPRDQERKAQSFKSERNLEPLK